LREKLIVNNQDWLSLTAREAYQFGLLPLVLWREARNQPYDAMLAVAWVVKNRVASPKWWGSDFPSVILKHYKGIYQFTSFDDRDPNAAEFPHGPEPEWDQCLAAAAAAFTGNAPDPTQGATHYFDKSLDANPPAWAKSGTMIHTADVGDFHFYREV